MLKLKKICKNYKIGDFIQHALKNVDITFDKAEFVAILGPSGSGKTTLLNIIGGLDRYDEGNLIINGKETKKFKDRDWDSYRNNCVGFIFQSYNLINHISVIDNVELGMTLSGISKKIRKQKAKEVLELVGLKEHMHKKPNQLSGGQMQRVAIARALANDPDVILADEPTGALDSTTSIQIMDLIKKISKDKLVIMVTHNPELASTYASRIIEFKDGELIQDTKKVKDKTEEYSFNIRKTAMNFFTALKLSFNNIKTKKGRTLLTAFASSIGIIGVALVLSLSNGFDIKIAEFQRDSLSSMPIIISESAMTINDFDAMHNSIQGNSYESYPTNNRIYAQAEITNTKTHINDINKEYLDYIKKANSEYVSGISYMRATSLNLLVKNNETIKPFPSKYMTILPHSLDENKTSIVDDNYDILSGNLAINKEELVIAVDSKNRIPEELLKSLGIDINKEMTFEDLIGKEIKIIFNEQYYKSLGDYYTFNTDFNNIYNDEKSLTLKIVGVIRAKESNMLAGVGSVIAYTEKLVDYVVNKNSQSDIVKLQQKVEYNVLTGEKIENTEEGMTLKNNLLSYLGADSVPVAISIYPRDFDSKDQLIRYLDDYNEHKIEEEKILYTDMAELITSLSGSMMSAITVVLISFSSISLIVSSIMIGIITYISVLERTKEIGILRALGARKKDVTRVFNAETIIIGLCSGMMGITIAFLLTIPANFIIEKLTELPNVAQLSLIHAIILLVISMVLTLIGGLIPAIMASKKDPVNALRTE